MGLSTPFVNYLTENAVSALLFLWYNADSWSGYGKTIRKDGDNYEAKDPGLHETY
jgi:hypothetical protein